MNHAKVRCMIEGGGWGAVLRYVYTGIRIFSEVNWWASHMVGLTHHNGAIGNALPVIVRGTFTMFWCCSCKRIQSFMLIMYAGKVKNIRVYNEWPKLQRLTYT